MFSGTFTKSSFVFFFFYFSAEQNHFALNKYFFVIKSIFDKILVKLLDSTRNNYFDVSITSNAVQYSRVNLIVTRKIVLMYACACI